MKQNEMKKLKERKKVTENQHFVLQLKGASGAINAEAQARS